MSTVTVHHGTEDGLSAEVLVLPHHRAGAVAAYAAELMGTPGFWTLFRNGERLADNEKLGRVFGNERMVIA